MAQLLPPLADGSRQERRLLSVDEAHSLEQDLQLVVPPTKSHSNDCYSSSIIKFKKHKYS